MQNSIKYQIWIRTPVYNLNYDSDFYVAINYVETGYVDDYIE